MKNLLERFESKLRQEGDCIVFTGCCNDKGYGVIGIQGFEPSDNPTTKKKALAHRVAWRLKYGVWPTGILRHTCDNPPCVKIKHLRDGTHKDNADDCITRGRKPKGEQIRNSKLTDEQVLEIRQLCKTRAGLKEIAMMYGVELMTISSIKEGRSWTHLPHEQARKPYSCQHVEIGGELWTIDEIAEVAGVSNSCIRARIGRGLTGMKLVAGRHRTPRKSRA